MSVLPATHFYFFLLGVRRAQGHFAEDFLDRTRKAAQHSLSRARIFYRRSVPMGLLRATVHAVVHRGRHNVTDAVSGIESGGSHSSPLHVLPTWLLVLLALCCLLVAAIASGSTIGFMGLDTIGLEIVANGTNPVDAAAAAAILPIRKQGNLLLCTLLLTNTLATEFLPLVLEALYPGLCSPPSLLCVVEVYEGERPTD
jgi:Cyclin M transmembrane N-terminal domain